MRFSNDASIRWGQVHQLLEQCEISLQSRIERAREIRKYVLYGSADGKFSRYNKLYHSLRLKSSYLFSSRTVRFSIVPPEGSDSGMAERCEEAAALLTQRFNASRAPKVITQCVFWSLAYGSMLAKFGWNGKLQCWPVEPAAFGVQRESATEIQDQGAMSLRFYSSRSEVERALAFSGRSQAEIEKIGKQLALSSPGSESPVPDNFIGRMIVSQVSPNIVGAVAGLSEPQTASIAPETSEELAEMRELRAWDDDARDWRVFTIALPDTVLFDRLAGEIDISGLVPYTVITPNPVYDYFWGASEGEMLAPLQAWREKRMDQLDKLFVRQLNPPGFAKGVTGLTDEKYAAAFRRGGLISAQMPNAELTPLYPQLPPESFSEINAIDSMFDATLGLPPVLQGLEPQGGKSGQGMSVMVQMASAPIVNQALEVERALSDAGQIVFRLLRKYDATVLTTDEGDTFTLGLLPNDCIVTVAAHSSSPLFASELKAEATQMLELGIIDGPTYVELTEPPMVDLIKERMKKRASQEQAQQDQALKMMTDEIQKAPPDDKAGLVQQLFAFFFNQGKTPSKPKKG